MNLSDTAILNIKGFNYRCIICRISKEIITFGDIKIEKKNFRYKSPIFLKDVDIEEVLVSNKISFGEKSYKYFIVYLYNDHKVKLLHTMLPKTSAYVSS